MVIINNKIINQAKINTYINTGTKAIRKVQDLRIKSSTKWHLNKFPVDKKVPESEIEFWKLNNQINKNRDNAQRYLRKIQMQNPDADGLTTIIANIAKHFKLGNCGEQSAIALVDTFHQQPDIKKAAIVSIKIKDQKGRLREGLSDDQFVVYGMKRSANPKDPDTFGKHAVMVHPWAGICLPIKEGLAKLKKKLKVDETNHKIKFSIFAQFDRVKGEEECIWEC